MLIEWGAETKATRSWRANQIGIEGRIAIALQKKYSRMTTSLTAKRTQTAKRMAIAKEIQELATLTRYSTVTTQRTGSSRS